MHRLFRWSLLGVGGAFWVTAVALLATGAVVVVAGWLWELAAVHPLIAVGALGLLALALLTSR